MPIKFYLKKGIYKVIKPLKESGILVSIFIDPDENQVKACREIKADFIEIHTGIYSESSTEKEYTTSLNNIIQTAKLAKQLGLRVNAGHGLNYHNVERIFSIPGLEELNIGHSIISRAVFIGLSEAVKEMKELINAHNLTSAIQNNKSE